MNSRSAALGIMLVGACGVGCIVALIAQPLVTPFPSTPPQVDPARLQAHVKKLSQEFYPRSYEQFANLDAAARYIQAQLQGAGAAVTVQQVKVQEARYQNIVARFGPSTDPVTVIGAHYDSHGDPSRAQNRLGYDGMSHTPGADDNASGVAGLLELARMLGQHKPVHAVELVAYTLEEPPHFRSEHMGSVWHAKALRAAGRKVRLMLSLEMIGYFRDDPHSQAYTVPGMAQLYSDRGDFIALVGKMSDFQTTRAIKALMAGASDLPVYSINAPRAMVGIDFSDHRSYWDLGYPAMMITDTAFLRNPSYHKAGDTWDKLDYRRMAKVVQGAYAVAQYYDPDVGTQP